MIFLKMKELPLNKAFMLLEQGLYFGHQANGGQNILWQFVAYMDFTPQFALVTGTWNYSYEALMKKQECVIAIPKWHISEGVEIGACSVWYDKSKVWAHSNESKVSWGPADQRVPCKYRMPRTDYIEKHNIFILDAMHAWMIRRKERPHYTR